jgi:hypothetical protein
MGDEVSGRRGGRAGQELMPSVPGAWPSDHTSSESPAGQHCSAMRGLTSGVFEGKKRQGKMLQAATFFSPKERCGKTPHTLKKALAGDVAQVPEHFHSMYEILVSIPRTTEKKKKRPLGIPLDHLRVRPSNRIKVKILATQEAKIGRILVGLPKFTRQGWRHGSSGRVPA